jgi:serine acetyltransferase
MNADFHDIDTKTRLRKLKKKDREERSWSEKAMCCGGFSANWMSRVIDKEVQKKVLEEARQHKTTVEVELGTAFLRIKPVRH